MVSTNWHVNYYFEALASSLWTPFLFSSLALFLTFMNDEGRKQSSLCKESYMQPCIANHTATLAHAPFLGERIHHIWTS